jgi:hypothetical protein
MPITWSYNSQDEANAAMLPPDLQDGTYWGTVIKSEIIKGGKAKDDGTLTKDFLKLNIKIDLMPGTTFAEASFFDYASFFFLRKHFWESAGEEHQIKNPDENIYTGRRVQCICKVETYYSNKHSENRKKLVVTDFVGNSKKESTSMNSVEPVISADPFIKEEIPF